jgi:hypothetical protein
VIQPVLPLHECVDPVATKSAAEPLHFVADSVLLRLLLSLFILLLTLLLLVLLQLRHLAYVFRFESLANHTT